MRSRQLDFLRCLAVTLVIGRHYDILALWHRVGWTGVDLFFVLSGFLISGLLFGEYRSHGRIRVGRFLIRRGFKIYPAFYVFIAWSLGCYALLGKSIPWGKFVAETVFVQNYLPGVWTHTWSLAVEEHFYFALPLVLLALVRIGRNAADPFRSIPWIYAAVAAVCFVLRMIDLGAAGLRSGAVIAKTHLVVDGLLLGVAISYVYHFRREAYDRFVARTRLWLLPAGLLLAVPCALPGTGSSGLRVTTEHLLLSLGFGAILVSALEWRPVPGALAARILSPVLDAGAYLGRHSYSVYLWHVPMAEWGLELLRRTGLFPGSPVGEFTVYFLGSFAIGVGMARLIEAPVLRLRDRLFPSRSGAVVPVGDRAAAAPAVIS